jgi:hypothetical protein
VRGRIYAHLCPGGIYKGHFWSVSGANGLIKPFYKKVPCYKTIQTLNKNRLLTVFFNYMSGVKNEHLFAFCMEKAQQKGKNK